jgi:lysophospholipase L1-like esterase
MSLVRALHLFVFGLVVVGVVALWNDITTPWRIVMAVLVVTVVGVRLAPLHHWVEYVAAGIGLLVVPVFALLGIDALLGLVHVDKLPIAVSLIVGAVIVLLVARVSLDPLWTGVTFPAPWAFAGGVTVLLVLVPGLIFAAVGAIKGDGKKLDQRPAVADLDVIVLGTSPASSIPAASTNGNWRVHTWHGQVAGDEIRWGPEGPPGPDEQANAERVLLLLPPRSDNDAVARWMALADKAEPRVTLTYPLLQDPSTAQLSAWNKPLSGIGGRRGEAMSLADLGKDHPSDGELGLRVATQAPTATGDLTLAVAHRPVLRFDDGETTTRPLDVDELLATGDFSMCDAGQKVAAQCEQLRRGSDFKTGFNHLVFDTDKVAHEPVHSRIYVHVTHALDPALIYLDYWWYLPNNPAHSGSGAFCGPGFTVNGATCFNHQSDWEGVTVILDAKNSAGAPLGVNYAEHDGTVRYSWAALQKLWDKPALQALAPQGALEIRPLVLVARGTHASYPFACPKRPCPRSAAPGLPNKGALEDNRHDGKETWKEGNEEADCAATCVATLPTRNNGREAAGWNAWAGEWGTANCVFGIFCSSSSPPQSPGKQGRYNHPWCTKATIDLRAGRFVDAGALCRTPTLSVGGAVPGLRLLALGDSYSSGEGAGDYEQGTDTSHDTCHRSRNAWPALVAEERHYKALPSLACSGALVNDVLYGRAHDREPERNLSQIGRIDGLDPDIVTISIGGNDVGFSDVLKKCIETDCVRFYHRASGDTLDAQADDLARRLPGAYRRIQAAAPHAHLIVVDYPKLFPDSDPANPTPNCAALNRITPAEGNYLNDKAERVDVAILAAARQAGFDAIDVSDALGGKGEVCSDEHLLNRTSLKLKLFSGSFHPNADGQERLAGVIAARLASLNG